MRSKQLSNSISENKSESKSDSRIRIKFDEDELLLSFEDGARRMVSDAASNSDSGPLRCYTQVSERSLLLFIEKFE